SLKPFRNASSTDADSPGDRTLRNPITGIDPCCARAVSGHAATAPPSAASNSRRPMVTVMRPPVRGCVNATIPRHERAVLTAWPLARAGRHDTGLNGSPPSKTLLAFKSCLLCPRKGTSGVDDLSSRLLPPPSLGERRHRGLARRRVAVSRRAVFAPSEGQRPEPRLADWRSRSFHDATDDNAIGNHSTRRRSERPQPRWRRSSRFAQAASQCHRAGLSSLRVGSFSRCGFMRDFNKRYASGLRQRHQVVVEFVKAQFQAAGTFYSVVRDPDWRRCFFCLARTEMLSDVVEVVDTFEIGALAFLVKSHFRRRVTLNFFSHSFEQLSSLPNRAKTLFEVRQR